MADNIEGNINLNIDTSGAVASLKRLQAQLAEFHTAMARGGGQANREAQGLQQNLINSINKTGQFSASMTKVASSTEAFTTALEKNKLSMGQHFRYAMASTKMFGKSFVNEFATIQKVAESRVRTLQTQFIGLGRDANGAMQAIKVRPLTLDMKDLGTQTQIAAQKAQIFNKLVDQGATNLLNWGKNTQWAGRQLMVGFTIPLTMFASTASRAFMDLEKQVIAFKRVYGDFSTTKEQTDAMAESVKALANEFTQYGVAVKDTMELAAKAAAMGKTGADLTAQIKETSRLAVLGQVDQQQALDTTISLTNAFGIAADQLAGKIDFLNAVENQTVTSISDLTVAIPKAGPVIKQMGGSVEDLTFLLTAMREGGINASEGANALKSGIAALINPTKTASDMLSGYGINIKKMVQSDKGDVKKLVIDFASALDKLDPLKRAKAIEQMFGKFQFSRISTLFQNVIKEGSQANNVLKLAGNSSQELAILSQRELSKVSESTTYKFEKAITDFQTALAPVGEQFLKLVTPIIEFGTKMLEKFNGMGDGVKSVITTIVTGVGVVGPVLLMTIGLFANAIANIITVVQFLRKAFGGAASGSKDVATSTEYMTQAQLVAEAAAAGLNQTHARLIQTYNAEAGALANLTRAYEGAARAAGLPIMGAPAAGKGGVKAPPMPMGRKYATGGIINGPGSGTSDSIPAMLSNGEAVIPAKQVKKYGGFIQSMISGNVPGFAGGGILGQFRTQKANAMNQSSQAQKELAVIQEIGALRAQGYSAAEVESMILTNPKYSWLKNMSQGNRGGIGGNVGFKGMLSLKNQDPINNAIAQAQKNANSAKSQTSSSKIAGGMFSKFMDSRAGGITKGIGIAGLVGGLGALGFGWFNSLPEEEKAQFFGSGSSSSSSDSSSTSLLSIITLLLSGLGRRYANGVVSVPGPKGAGDVVPAMLSPGESVIPADMTKKYGGLIEGMVSGNIPGYNDGVTGLQMTMPGGGQLGHFSVPESMSGADLLDHVRSMAELGKATQAQVDNVQRMVSETTNGLESMFRVFDSRVELVSTELNQMVGEEGSGKTAPKSLVQRDLVERARDARSPLIDKLTRNGVSPQDAIAKADLVTAEVSKRLALLGDEVVFTAEDISRLTQESYDAVAAVDEDVNTAYSQMKELTTVKDESGNRGSKGQRTSIGKTSYIPQRQRLAKQRLTYDTAYTAGAFKTTPQMATAAGMSEAEIQAKFKALPDEAKPRVYAALKQGTDEFVAMLISESENAIETGFDRATERNSPPQAAIDAGADYGNALTDGVRSTIDDAEVAGQNLGQATVGGTQAAIDDTRKPTGQRVSRRAQRGAGTPGGNFTTITRPKDPLFAGGGRSIVIPVEQYMPQGKPVGNMGDPNVDPNPGKSQKINKFNKIKGTISNKVSNGVKGMGGTGLGMGISMAGMGIGMIPGLGELGTALSMIGPLFMMMSPAVAGVVAALGLLAFGVYKLVEAQEQQRQKAIDLANASTMSQAAVENMSKDFGTVSVTEARKTEQNARMLQVTEKQLTAGEQYITQMESGKQLLAGVQSQQAAGVSTSEIGKNVASNLANAVAQQVITKDQGTEIIAALASSSGNLGLSGEATDQFNAYTKDPTKTSIMSSQQNLANIQNGMNKAMSAELVTTTGNVLTDYVNQLGAGLTEVGLDFRGGGGRLSQQQYAAGLGSSATGNRNQVRQLSTTAINAYGQATAGSDTINAAYDTKIANAKNPKEIKTLEGQRTTDLRDQVKAANQIYDQIRATKVALGDADFSDTFMQSVKTTFGEGSPAAITAQKINDLGNSTFKTRLQAQLESGSVSPETLDVMMQYGQGNETFGANYNLAITARGEKETMDLISYAQVAGGSENRITVLLDAYTNAKDPETARLLSLGVKGASEVGVNINATGTQQLTDIGTVMDKIGDKSEVPLKFLMNNTSNVNWKKWEKFAKSGKLTRDLVIRVLATGELDILNAYLKAKGVKGISGSDISRSQEGSLTAGNATNDAKKNVEVQKAIKKSKTWFAKNDPNKTIEDGAGGGGGGGGTGGGGGGSGTALSPLDIINKKIAVYQAALDVIAIDEKKINDAYDKRNEALDKIRVLNEQISKQKEIQLGLTDAITRGDIAAAAAAAQQVRANAQQTALDQQKKALDEAKQRELDAIMFQGKTRKEYEALMDPLQRKAAILGYKEAKKAATGGHITGPGTGTSDSIPARLSNGEYVINAKSVQKVGVPFLNSINSQKFATGGMVKLAHLTKDGKSFDINAQAFSMGGVVTPSANRYSGGGFVGMSTADSSAVYNYSINIDVATDANADDIAGKVMSQIRQLQSKTIGGTAR